MLSMTNSDGTYIVTVVLSWDTNLGPSIYSLLR